MINYSFASGKVNAFITTFHPTLNWVKNYKKGTRNKFQGSITFTKITLDPNESINDNLTGQLGGRLMNTSKSSYMPGCDLYYVWEKIAIACTGYPVGGHLPGDLSCALIGTFGEAYYTWEMKQEYDCTNPNPYNPPGGGGTEDDPPPGYDPNCENNSNYQSSIREIGFSRIAAIPPPGCDEFDEEPAIPNIDNDVDIPCIAAAVNILLDNNSTSNGIAKIIKNFMTNPALNLKVVAGQTQNDAPAQLQLINSSATKIEGTITLDLDYIMTFSNEAIVSKMIHEILHAHLEVAGITGNNPQHSEMGEKYIDPMAHLLKDIFPNMPAQDALYLAYSGLAYHVGQVPSNITSFTHVINNQTVTIDRALIGSIDYNYNKSSKGTPACPNQ